MADVIRRFSVRPKIRNWTDGTTWGNWERHEAFLRSQPKWKPHQVDSVRDESLKIIGKTTDLRRSEFQCRGLVVGYVQSGKTANFTAVAARAADVGYRLVIVLSGVHDSLRNQTQVRLNRELAEIGVNWQSLTTETNDFEVPINPDGFESTGTVLIVVKKICAVLRKVSEWVRQLDGKLGKIPVLMIDDEADQASVNTRGNRRDPDEQEPPDPDAIDGNPTETNRLIREILGHIPKATYIGYTATPFANILINPDAYDHEVGEDLFPRDFVVQLPRPDGYTGTEELFGVTAQGRDVLRIVDPADAKTLKTKRRRKRDPLVVQDRQGIPQSLCDALLVFAVAGAIRRLRGQVGKPHTMLVHSSVNKGDQQFVGDAIAGQIQQWTDYEKVKPGSLRNMLSSALNDIGRIDLPVSRDEVLNEAEVNFARLVVVVLNSDTKAELEYEKHPDRQLIAVGGNRLSRGLTLEGLTISYFLRTATLADGLLQMARWYGFRTGYEDLIRIWTTEDIAGWFVELALVEESLRDSINAMNKAGRRPDQMAIKMRAHSELLLTSKAKSCMLQEISRSWSSENPQTILFPIRQPDRLDRNLRLTSHLLKAHPTTQDAFGGSLAHDVPPEVISEYLRYFAVHEDAIAFRNDLIADWIMERAAVGELVRWTVFVANPERDRQVILGSKSYGLVTRTATAAESIGILTDPRHEGVDLDGGPESHRRGTTYNAKAMRLSRPASRGLLIVYPLDPEPLHAPTRAVIGLALSLPKTSDEGKSFVANKGLSYG
jgi:hypothetical protein